MLPSLSFARHLSILAVLFSGPALAQTFESEPRQIFVQGNTSASDPVLRDLVPANLNEDGVVDMVGIYGDYPIIFDGVAQTSRRVPLAIHAVDAELLPGRDADGTDMFFTAGNDGLTSWRVSGTTYTSKAYHSGYLAPLSRVAVYPMGSLDVVVTLSADGLQYQLHYFSSVTAIPIYTGAPVSLPSAAGTLALADVTAGGLPSIIVTHADGLGVYSISSGSQIELHGRFGGATTTDPTTDVLAVIENGTQDEVVWVESFASIVSFLHVIRYGADEGPTALPGFQPVYASACDADGTGEIDDVAFSLAQGRRALILLNQGSAPSLSLDSKVALEFGVAETNTAAIAASDQDGDGDMDITLALGSPSRAYFWEGQDVDAQRLAPAFLDATFTTTAHGFTGAFEFDLPQPGLPTGATELEIRAWSRPASGTSLTMLDGLPAVYNPPGGATSVSLTFPTEVGKEVGYVQARYVRRVPGEAPRSFPGTNILVTSKAVHFDYVAENRDQYPYLSDSKKQEADDMGDDSAGDGNGPEEMGNGNIVPKPSDGGVVVDIPIVPLD